MLPRNPSLATILLWVVLVCVANGLGNAQWLKDPALNSAGHIGVMAACQSDSLVDCFPLSIGSQWLYHYKHSNYEDLDPGWMQTTDTGTVVYTVMAAAVSSDSTIWTFRQERNLLHVYVFFNGQFDSSAAVIVDTTTFDVVEQNSDRHPLYRLDSKYMLTQLQSSGDIWNCLIPPLMPSPDTGRLFRYYLVDSMSLASYTTSFSSLGIDMAVQARRGVGLLSVSFFSVITLWLESADYRLLSHLIVDVRSPQEQAIPTRFSLSQNYPNPFNPATTIGYTIGGVAALSGAHLSGVEGRAVTNVRLVVYDILGREVAVLVNEPRMPGSYEVNFNGAGLSSGVYIYRMSAGNFRQCRRMLLVK